MATKAELMTHSGIEICEILSPVMKWYKTATTDILAKGDLLQEDTNAVELLISTWEADEFAGICLYDSPGADVETNPQIVVATRAVCRVKNVGAAVTPGAVLKISAGPTAAQKAAGTKVDFDFTAGAGEGLCWVLENITATTGTGLVLFDIWHTAAVLTSLVIPLATTD